MDQSLGSVRNAGEACARGVEAPGIAAHCRENVGGEETAREEVASRCDPGLQRLWNEQTPEGSERSGEGCLEKELFQAADEVQTSKAGREVKVREEAENQ